MPERSRGVRGILIGVVVPALLLGAARGVGLRAQQNPAEVPSRIDPKAQQVIDRVIRALGGPAFLNMKRLTTRGRIYSIRDESTSGFPLSRAPSNIRTSAGLATGRTPLSFSSTMATRHGNWTGTDKPPSRKSRPGAGGFPIAMRWRISSVSASMNPEFSFSRAVLTLWITSPHKLWTWLTNKGLN